jgi:hypothetical protein
MTWTIKNVLEPSSAIDYASGLIGADLNPLPTGIRSWDAACYETNGAGLANWWFTIIGGASNSGKTQLLQHLMKQAWLSKMNPGLITMEVPLTGIQRSVYSRISDFQYHDLMPHLFDDVDAADKVLHLSNQVKDYAGEGRNLLVAEHDGSPDLGQIVEMCYAMKESGCGVIGLDHLQLIKSPISEIGDPESGYWYWHCHSLTGWQVVREVESRFVKTCGAALRWSRMQTKSALSTTPSCAEIWSAPTSSGRASS